MVREKATLPFEVTYSQKPSEKSKNMKRLAFIVKPENLDDIISSLSEMGLEATIYDVRSVGKDRERVTSGRGSGTSDLGYTTRKVVATVVSSDHVNDIVERMKKALEGDKAVVMISAVDDLVML
ncbi:MAG TPA: P-II family nitrogen regulator [Nitrososphaeraceae archaeon]|jgi:nitrogen regulatory protein PII|nr:P-II family nitrogen regulator [Nitrososphaeraceae archaeon]